MKWIILDFGSHQVKALKTEIDGQKVRILDFFTWTSSPDFFEGLEFPTSSAWSKASQELNARGWLSDEGLVVCSHLPSTYLETRYLRFPFKSDKKIEKVLPLEIESAVPFDVDDILLKSRILKGPGVEESPEALVLVMAYKRDLIQKYETELRHFQVSIPSISVDILNLASLRQVVKSDPIFGFLNIGHRKTQLLLLQDSGSTIAARTFFWGGEALRQKLESQLKVTPERALELLRGNASFDVTTESQSVHIEMAEALEESLNQFLNEFRQSLKSFQQQGLTLPKGLPIYILGKPAQIPGIRTRMEERFKLEFDLRFFHYPFEDLNKVVQGLMQLDDPIVALPAIAQALGQTRQHRPKIQPFSESSFQFQQNIKKLRSESFGLIRKAAVLLIAPAIYLIVSFFIQQREAAHLSGQIEKKLNQAGIEIDATQPTDRIIKELNQMLIANREKIEQLKEDQTSPLFILSDLSKAISPNIKLDVKEFRVSDDKVFISGQTNSEENRRAIVSAIATIFGEIREGNSTTCEGEGGCVTLNVEFNRPSTEQP